MSVPELDLPRADVLIAEARALLEPYVQIVELGDREVGLVYKNERLAACSRRVRASSTGGVR